MLNTEEFKVIILSAFFLIYSYMIYLIPLLAGFYLIFLYCLFSNKKKKNFQIFFYFIIFLFLFLIAFDILTNFFLSDIFLIEFNNFLSFGSHLRDIPKIIRALLIYSILGGVLISYFIFLKSSNKYIHGKKANKEKNFFQRKFSESKIWSIIKKNPKFIFIFSLIIFSALLIIEIHNIVLEEFFLDYKLIELDFLAFYLDKIFINIGFIGILAVYLSYFCFKKKKQLFYVLISWILISLGLASIIIFKEFFIDYPFIIPQDLPEYDYFMMNYWFERVWYYSIPAFSILSSIGLIKLKKKLKNNRFLVKRKNIREIFMFSSFSILIFLSCSTFVLGGMYWACSYKSGTGGYSDSEAQIVGWISEHIPRRSNISIDNFFLSQSRDKKRMLEYMTDCNAFYINDIVEVALKEKNCWDWEFINKSDINCRIGIIDDLNGHQKVLKCEDQNNTGSVNFQFKFDSPQNYGTIDFYIRTTDKSKNFYIEFLDKLISQNPIALEISDAFYYYDGTKFEKILNIENNKWYHIKIDFECSNEGYNGLNQYKWKFFVDNIKYGEFFFWNNVSQIERIRFISRMSSFGWNFYFDAFNFSWDSEFNVENCIFLGPIIINYLKKDNIHYLILSEEETLSNNKNEKINIQNDLITKYFNTKIYEYKDFAVYYAST